MRIGLVKIDSLLLVIVTLGAGAQTITNSGGSFSTREVVGRLGTNRFYTPANQILTPAGIQVELPGMRPQAVALSP